VKRVLPAELDLGEPEVANCPMCGTLFKRTLVRFDLRGHFLGYFPADVCSQGHDFLTEESSKAIEQAAQALGLFGPARTKSKGAAAQGAS
jgi:hypothetical protein